MNDVLGHPIVVGATVLTGSYGSPTMDKVTTVKKVTRTKVHVSVPTLYFDRPTHSILSTNKHVARNPYQVVVVTNQIKHNRKTYPENLL